MITTLQISPDNRYLATGSRDYTVNLIDIHTLIIKHKFANIHSGDNKIY